jgi:hypothetical protein
VSHAFVSCITAQSFPRSLQYNLAISGSNATQGAMGMYLPSLQNMVLDDDFPSWQLLASTAARPQVNYALYIPYDR